MAIKKELLIEGIQAYLQLKPEDSHEFLAAISDGLRNYKESVRKEREGIAIQAIEFLFSLICPDLSRKNSKLLVINKADDHYKFICIIDAIVIKYPQAKPIGESKNGIYIFNMFVEICKRLDVLKEERWISWLDSIKSSRNYDYKEYITKALEYNGN